MKNKTIVNILAMAEMYKQAMLNGTPPICITAGKPPEYPSQEYLKSNDELMRKYIDKLKVSLY